MHLQVDPFTVESGILTPTMKLKRNIAREMYAQEIETMYQADIMKLKNVGDSQKTKEGST